MHSGDQSYFQRKTKLERCIFEFTTVVTNRHVVINRMLPCFRHQPDAPLLSSSTGCSLAFVINRMLPCFRHLPCLRFHLANSLFLLHLASRQKLRPRQWLLYWFWHPQRAQTGRRVHRSRVTAPYQDPSAPPERQPTRHISSGFQYGEGCSCSFESRLPTRISRSAPLPSASSACSPCASD